MRIFGHLAVHKFTHASVQHGCICFPILQTLRLVLYMQESECYAMSISLALLVWCYTLQYNVSRSIYVQKETRVSRSVGCANTAAEENSINWHNHTNISFATIDLQAVAVR